MNSDRMRTVQLNVCDSKEVDRAVEHVNSSLEDPEKGTCMQWTLGSHRWQELPQLGSESIFRARFKS